MSEGPRRRDLGDLMIERAHKRVAEEGCTFEEALEYVQKWFLGKFYLDKMFAESLERDDVGTEPTP